MFPTYTVNERVPYIKKSAVSELFFLLYFYFIYKANERISFNMRTLIPINNSLKTVGNINTDAEYIKKK